MLKDHPRERDQKRQALFGVAANLVLGGVSELCSVPAGIQGSSKRTGFIRRGRFAVEGLLFGGRDRARVGNKRNTRGLKKLVLKKLDLLLYETDQRRPVRHRL